ncbi:hypothetical protein BDQ17DRAFT_1355343 [Cyathus striatus]|nr:hypothetical protein BDQ17DRAFT_1355343 [Cyathus striatus]
MDSSSPSTTIVIFNILSFLAIVLVCLAILPPLFSSQIKRSSTWFIHLISWLVYSISFVFIIGQQTGPEPEFGACLFQASLIYSTPPFCAFAATFFLAEFYLQIRSFLYGSHINKVWRRFFNLFPVVLFACLICFALVSTQDASSPQRIESGLFCHIVHGPQYIVSAVLIIIAAAIMIPLQVVTFRLLYRNRSTLKEQTSTDNTPATISISVSIRMMLFTLIVGIGIGLTILVTSSESNDASRIGSLLLPTLPILSAISFGTQTDVFRLQRKSQIETHDDDRMEKDSAWFTSNANWMKLDLYRKENRPT